MAGQHVSWKMAFADHVADRLIKAYKELENSTASKPY